MEKEEIELNFQISDAKKKDFKKISDLINDNIDLTRKLDERICMKSGIDFFVVKLESKIIGCGGVKRVTKNSFEIAHLAIEKNFRGIGIGNMLIEFLLKKGFSQGFGKAFATVNTKNRKTIKILEKIGFVKEGKLKHHFGKGRHIYIYAKYKEY